MTLRPRSDWTGVPAANANPIDPDEVVGVCVHWNGPAVPLSALVDPRNFLEAVRRFHVSTNGWSDIAYNRAVDQTGDRWQLRGLRHKSAANGTTALNERWIAVYAIIGQGQEPTPALIRGLVEEIAAIREVYPRATRITGHGLIDPTSVPCPGPDLTAAVKSGALDQGDDDVTEADKDDIAAKVCDLLLGARATALRGQVRLALDAELGDESGLEELSNRIAGKVQAKPVDADALAEAVAAKLAARLAS